MQVREVNISSDVIAMIVVAFYASLRHRNILQLLLVADQSKTVVAHLIGDSFFFYHRLVLLLVSQEGNVRDSHPTESIVFQLFVALTG